MSVDPRAAVSLISKEVLDNLDLCDQFLQKVPTELKTAVKEPLQVYCQTEIPLTYTFIIPVIVAKLGDFSGVLGLDFLSENDVIFDLRKRCIKYSSISSTVRE